MSDHRPAAWDARKAEQGRLTMLLRQRRLVFGTYGEVDGGERAQELDYLIAKSELLIADYAEQCCTRPVSVKV